MRTTKDRFHNDPYFAHLVNLFLTEIRKGQTSPSEIREAAMVAQIMYEGERPSQIDIEQYRAALITQGCKT